MTSKKLIVIIPLLIISTLLCSCSNSLLKDLFASDTDIHEHSYYDATCTTPKTCKTCNATLGTAIGHSWLEATCTTPKICINCHKEVGDSLGHEWKDATYITPKTCSRCDATEGNPIEYLGKIYTGGSSSTHFHFKPNCAGVYSHEITWEDVKIHGLEPCGNCVK